MCISIVEVIAAGNAAVAAAIEDNVCNVAPLDVSSCCVRCGLSGNAAAVLRSGRTEPYYAADEYRAACNFRFAAVFPSLLTES